MSILYTKHSDFPDAILIRNFKNSVDVSEIIKSWENLKENDLLTDKVKGVINNLIDCDLNMNMDSFKILMGYLKQNECFYRIKLAVICNKPKIVVYPTLGEEKEGDLKIKPFSTIDAAVEWIID